MSRRPLAAALFAAAFALTACDDGPKGPLQTRDDVFAWSGEVAPGRTLTVRDFSGDVEVKPSADGTARVSARLEWRKGDPDEKLRVVASNGSKGPVICAIWGEGDCNESNFKSNMSFGDDAKLHFTVELPAGARLDVVTISGDIAVAASAPVHAMTMNGDLRIATAVGPVDAEALNGSVDVRMSTLVGSDSVIAKTLNGDVFVYLPALDDAVLDLGVANGKVSSDFAPAGVVAAGKRITGTIGAGTRVLHAYALNGTVALRRLGADGTAP